MLNKTNSKSDFDQPTVYQIRVKGRLNHDWSDWFEGMKIAPDEDGNTLLSGLVIDDAALHGLLKRVRDSGLRLLSVNRVENISAKEDDHEKPNDGFSDQNTKGCGA